MPGCPPDCLQKVFVCASQSAAANNLALLSSALVFLSAGREAYGPEEAVRWLLVSRFSSTIVQLCQPIAVSAGRHMAWTTMILSHTAVPERERASLIQGPLALDGLFGPRFSEVLAHQQSVRENRSRFGEVLTGSSHQQAGKKRGRARSQRSRGPPPTPPQPPQSQPQPGRAAQWSQKHRTQFFFVSLSGGCRVVARWRVYITSGSPASNKWHPIELCGQAGDSLHKPVDTDECTSLLVPHIIPATSLLQSVEGGRTGLRAVVTASG